jgi:hypothetical protein
MPDQTFLILVVALMMAVTFLPRALPLQVNTEHWPPFVARALEYLPVAIVAAISLTPLLIKDQHIQLDRPNFMPRFRRCYVRISAKTSFSVWRLGRLRTLRSARSCSGRSTTSFRAWLTGPGCSPPGALRGNPRTRENRQAVLLRGLTRDHADRVHLRDQRQRQVSLQE